MKGQSYVKQEGKHQKRGVLLGSVGDEVKIQQDDGGRGGAPKPKRQSKTLVARES